MPVPVICHSCGDSVPIPAGYARGKIRCPACGVYCEVPPQARREAAESDTTAPAPIEPVEPVAVMEPTSAAMPQASVPFLTGTDEDDGQPYSVPADPVAPPKPTKDDTPRPPLSRSWDIGWPLSTRRKVFGLLLVIDVIALPFSTRIFNNLPVALGMLALSVSLQAFLLGTFDRIDLSRNAKGKVRLTKSWRVAFIALPAVVPIRWSEFESLLTGKSHEPRIEDWVVVAILLPYGIVPGVLWWWYVIQTDRVHVAMCKDHGFPDTILFRGMDVARAEEVARTVADVTGLPYNQSEESR